MGNDDSGSKSYHFAHYAVAVVDLLSQANLLEKLNQLPGAVDSRDEYVDAVRETVGRVILLRRGMHQSFNAFLNRPQRAGIGSLSQAHQAAYTRLRSLSLQTQQFSDTIVAYSPLMTPSGDLTVSGIYGIMAACAQLMLSALAVGIPVRGGIDVGIGVELADADLYGPALSHAYHLEHTVAQYPRLVAGRGLLDYLSSWEDPTIPNGIVNAFNRQLARTCRSFITTDDDEVQMLDYLGQPCRKVMDGPGYQELVALAFAFATAEYDRFTRSGDTKLGPRYDCLRRYFASRMS